MKNTNLKAALLIALIATIPIDIIVGPLLYFALNFKATALVIATIKICVFVNEL